MGNCEMCGSEGELFQAEIENTILNVCPSCAKYGKIIRKVQIRVQERSKKKIVALPEKEIVQMIIEDYPTIIKEKRERMGLKQIELAKRLSERESLIQKIESGNITPSLELARKLEKFLRIELIEEKEIKSKSMKTSSSKLTIGDMIKLK